MTPRTPCIAFVACCAHRSMTHRTPCSVLVSCCARKWMSPRTPCNLPVVCYARRSMNPRTPCIVFVSCCAHSVLYAADRWRILSSLGTRRRCDDSRLLSQGPHQEGWSQVSHNGTQEGNCCRWRQQAAAAMFWNLEGFFSG
eukprot:3261138-Rhodomonas_salina.3